MKSAKSSSHEAFAAQAQPTAADLQQARTARLQHLKTPAAADAQLGHAADPFGFAGNVLHVGPFAGLQHFQL